MNRRKNGRKKEETEDRIREPEEKIRKPEDKAEDVSGVSRAALRGLGKLIPGFDELTKGLEKSEAFKERLRALDTEIEHKLEMATALRRQQGSRRSIIPPRTTLKRTQPAARIGSISPKTAPKADRATRKKEVAERLPQREMIAEVLDEGDHLEVIAEMPGVNEKAIRAYVKDNLLIVSARARGLRYYKEIKLPCAVEDAVNLTCRNGVLQVILDKLRE